MIINSILNSNVNILSNWYIVQLQYPITFETIYFYYSTNKDTVGKIPKQNNTLILDNLCNLNNIRINSASTDKIILSKALIDDKEKYILISVYDEMDIIGILNNSEIKKISYVHGLDINDKLNYDLFNTLFPSAKIYIRRKK